MTEPTNGELKIMLTGLYDKFDEFRERNGEEHSHILIEAKMTNGRVSSLEQYRSMAVGALAVVSAMLIPLFVSFMRDYFSK